MWKEMQGMPPWHLNYQLEAMHVSIWQKNKMEIIYSHSDHRDTMTEVGRDISGDHLNQAQNMAFQKGRYL